MNDESNVRHGPLSSNGGQAAVAGIKHNGANGFGSNGRTEPKAADFWPFVEALRRNWGWLLFGGILLASVGLAFGLIFLQSTYTASARLVRYDSPNIPEVFSQQQVSPETFASLLRGSELLQRVSAKAHPPISIQSLEKNLQVTPERNSDVITITISARSRRAAVDLANLFARETVLFTREQQSNNAVEVSQFLTKQITPIEQEIAAVQYVPKTAAQPTAISKRLEDAQAELADLLARYTEKHPLVREQRSKVTAIEGQLLQNPEVGAPTEETPASFSMANQSTTNKGSDLIFAQTKLQSLEMARLTLLNRKHAALTLESNPPGSCQVLAEATPKDIVANDRTLKVAVLSMLAGIAGILGFAGLVLLAEVADNRLKTGADVKRVTRLPVLAYAGDLGRMTQTEQENWAFRAWTNLQGHLSPSPNHGLVCGITSSSQGEGRSTWLHLLADAASKRGFRVLTIVAGHGTNGHVAEIAQSEDNELPVDTTFAVASVPVDTNVLATPSDVTQKLVGPNPQPMVQIPLPGWVWNLERRKQWQAALNHWSQIDNIAILVELPPASVPEAVLLAENLPNLIWLADASKADAGDTREQLETLRRARCALAGAVLNHAPASHLKARFARWFSCFALLTGLYSLPAVCAETEVQVTNQSSTVLNTNRSFSVVSPSQRAAWQQHLTLGPGDVLTMALYGEPTLTRMEVAVGPDGRISFAEAQDILATGLTIDELRTKIDQELGKFRRAPQSMITPVAFRSKRYYMLGKVMIKGVYTLDRPITVLEAVARARGFESGMVERNIIDMADFSRSFLMRSGKRFPLDFEKLFQGGDLSQNVPIEPGDYIYFPSTNVKEVYVVGEVGLPGPVIYTPDLTIIGAISARVGFNDRAYKSRVVVVRGSLTHPEAFTVDTTDILAGKTSDFKLQPKDIIFVNSRPFIRVEELTELAATAFIQSIITAWIGVDVIKPFQE